MNGEEGFYLYGIIATNNKQDFGPIGIGGRGDKVYALAYQDIAAVISKSPIQKYDVTRDNVSGHAQVLETVAKDYTVLPVRYCTIATDEEMIISKLLKERHQELVQLLQEMQGKIELGLRARWQDMDAIFAEVVEENQTIKTMKEAALREKDKQKKYADSVKIGEMVQKALEQKRTRETQALLDAIKPLSLDYKENQLYGDMNLLNAAFLVDKAKEGDFDQKVNDLQKEHENRTLLIYNSSAVPYNFVELVVKW
ncbi:GvpL/GvpF family gas vesicle protein [Dictyobacter formicarum]|uniref:Gas vesicle synthesis GvpLGvpF n=1 Tax=Dictyobacter formicarum TaxID=2778368 RepID=A0ABQ3VBH9_9CHLR|nr:GvpL/GvpF family gas vesicle protein [Dictyobacter formicarum]GHO83145.1 hypothetical protein KSZ_11510 [Dictyobacter formicarum]